MTLNPQILKILRRAYILQAVGVILWWTVLLCSVEYYNFFSYKDIPWKTFLVFLPIDLLSLVIVPLSFCIKPQAYKQKLILAGIALSTFSCILLSLTTNSGWFGTAIMIIGFLFNCGLYLNSRMFVRKESSTIKGNLTKTFLQTLFVWWISLYFFPSCILEVFPAKVSVFNFQPWHIIVYLLALLLAGFNFWAGYEMAKKGMGTPLPMDTTTKLVSSGPYKYVRNPMSVTGLGLGLCEAVLFMSPALLVYVFVGYALWNFFIRPIEEIDMLDTFGDEFQDYRSKVKCWIPCFPK